MNQIFAIFLDAYLFLDDEFPSGAGILASYFIEINSLAPCGDIYFGTIFGNGLLIDISSKNIGNEELTIDN